MLEGTDGGGSTRIADRGTRIEIREDRDSVEQEAQMMAELFVEPWPLSPVVLDRLREILASQRSKLDPSYF